MLITAITSDDETVRLLNSIPLLVNVIINPENIEKYAILPNGDFLLILEHSDEGIVFSNAEGWNVAEKLADNLSLPLDHDESLEEYLVPAVHIKTTIPEGTSEILTRILHEEVGVPMQERNEFVI